ncbi:type II toxin-antitoxin system VapC family toxin [Thermococcus sp.]
MKVVADTSVMVSLFSSFYPYRTEISKRIASLTEMGVIELYSPRLGEFEFIAVITRFLSRELAEEAWGIYRSLITEFLGEGVLSDLLRELSFETSHRIPDLYFIATARYLNAVLITNDKRMAELAGKLGLRAFYLVEDSGEFFKSLEVKE